ncbi:MAG: hypothetical protein C4523_20210 [Myxococcales bacterium]|nr:MAG: hypothetical protein C4523_20210 [Myxococcales bacterium]
MKILGVSCYYHDAAAALVIDGQIIAAAEEERFTRKKHDNRFPAEAIRFCLQYAGLQASDLDLACFYEKPLLKLERTLSIGRRYAPASHDMVRRQLSHAVHERLFFARVLAEQIGYAGPVQYAEHHLSHAASSYFISDFDRAAILTVDGVGEWATTVQYLAEGNRILKRREIRYPHSIGLLYSAITAFLGFKVNNDEYKVMGLASYGKPERLDELRDLIRFLPDGSFRLNLDYFDFMHNPRRMYSDRFIRRFGPPRTPESEITQAHMDLAASVQKLTEEAMIALGNDLHRTCGGVENVCLAGGVALNCVANEKFMRQTPFKRISIQPAAGDGGGALGAALYAAYAHGEPRPPRPFHSTLLGPEFSRQAIRDLLIKERAAFTEMDEDAICHKAAQLIAENQILGWFQGRMEYGPRALGNRSILANACNPAMKDVLNARVKFREDFRPFAPAVLEERAKDYFDIDFPSPYMLFAPQVKPGMGARIPSVTHFDNTARVQTVSRAENPRFHKVISAFETLAGVPVVINTSFNIRGEPIVCTPKEAYDCFMKTDIDFLIMGDFLVEKEL